MIRYFCDKCEQEIKDQSDIMEFEIACPKLLGKNILTHKYMHESCARDFLGSLVIEKAHDLRSTRTMGIQKGECDENEILFVD